MLFIQASIACILLMLGVVDSSATPRQDDFEHFRSTVLNEIQLLKERDAKFESDVQVLKLENDEKEKEIRQLKSNIKRLEDDRIDCKKGSLDKRGLTGAAAVAFTAYIDHSVHNLVHDQAIIYNKVLLNDGGYYNASSGEFIVPFTGVYLFSYSVGAKVIPGVQLKQYDVFTRLMVDSDYKLSAVAESTSSYDDEQGSSTAILLVEEGSKVWTKHEIRGGNNLYADAQERISSFTGTLLYQTEPLGIQGIIG